MTARYIFKDEDSIWSRLCDHSHTKYNYVADSGWHPADRLEQVVIDAGGRIVFDDEHRGFSGLEFETDEDLLAFILKL